jgi:peptide-methionine (S)-S-oxide reductase
VPNAVAAVAGEIKAFGTIGAVNQKLGGKMTQEKQVAVFGGGCFWCTEAVFDELGGVISVTPGYTGGSVKNPTYEKVCSGETGHAEVIRIEFDPRQIAFKDLLAVFFATHDPTTLNHQGADVGTQYRSVVFYADEEQKHQAESLIKELNDKSSFGQPVVTTVEALKEFYPAEDYHRKYYANNTYQPYCQITIPPKLNKLHKQFGKLLKSHTGH